MPPQEAVAWRKTKLVV